MDADLHDALKEFAAVLPGATVSGLINDALRPMLPHMLAFTTAFQEQNEVEAKAVLKDMIGSLVLDIHTPGRFGPGKGADS